MAVAMPVVSATITHRQWHDWDQQHSIKPKSLPTLAEEGLSRLSAVEPLVNQGIRQLVAAVSARRGSFQFGRGKWQV